MPNRSHPDDLLLAHLDGTLASDAAERVSRHLAGCRECGEERAALERARALLEPVRAEPRPGFAARVAREAKGPGGQVVVGAPWWRWAAGGGLALASLAALALVAVGPRRGGPQRSEDLRMAQRLDLYEDMSVLQHQQALEDLEVVEVLHTLQPGARP